ncbi:MAG TPA: hypothetical protein VKR52_08400 [Terracidiphilus sp.]|nr:hypothetical protein [Terracidiphilus sp.]
MIDPGQSGRFNESLAPPAPFRQSEPGVLKITRGGGAIAIFGMPFLLAGAFMLLTAAAILPLRTGSGGAPAPILIPMGFVFLAVGGIMVFGRQVLILDLHRRSIIRQLRLLIPLRTDERPLSDFNAVVTSHNPGDSEAPETYPVMLRASVGKDVTITKPLLFGESQRIAQHLARTLPLPMVDSTTDRELRVDPEDVGKSLQERTDPRVASEPQPRPVQMSSQIEENASETKIVIPAGAPRPMMYIRMLLPIAVCLIATLCAIPVLAKSANPSTLLLIFLVLFGLPTVWASIYFARLGQRKNTTVTISRSRIVIARSQGRMMQTTDLPASDVLDVDYSTIENAVASARSAYPAGIHPSESDRVMATVRKLVPNPGIIIKSRNGLITVGEGLSSDELKYLTWVLRKALLSSRALAD